MNSCRLILILTFLIWITCNHSHAQSIKLKYFKDEYLNKETTESKAKYVQKIFTNTDSSTTTKVANIKSNKIIFSKTLKRNEPFGVWIYRTSNQLKELDYNFNLVYSDNKCTSYTPPDGINIFKDNASLHYVAPKLLGNNLTLNEWIFKNMVYPAEAVENNISGRVLLRFTISDNGIIENLVVAQGVNISLDKEAARVIRNTIFTPATLDGKAQAICAELPINFQLM